MPARRQRHATYPAPPSSPCLCGGVTKSRVGAAGTSVAGAIILGPLGLLAGAVIRGNDVEVPRGVVVTDKIRNAANVRAM